MSLAALRMLKCRLCSQPQAGPEGLCRDCARALMRARHDSEALKAAAAGSARKRPVVERIVLTSPVDGETGRAPARGRAVLWTVTGMVALVVVLAATAGRSPQRTVEPNAPAHAARVVPPLLEPSLDHAVMDGARINADPLAPPQNDTAIVEALPRAEPAKAPVTRPTRATTSVSTGARALPDTRTPSEVSRASSAESTGADPDPPLQQARVSVAPGKPANDESSLASALEKCSEEKFLAGVICEQKARLRYCEGKWGQVPQCTAKPRVD